MRTEVTPSPTGFVPNNHTQRVMEAAEFFLQRVIPAGCSFVLVVANDIENPDGSVTVDGTKVNTLATGNAFGTRESVKKFLAEAAGAGQGYEIAVDYTQPSDEAIARADA